MQSAQIKATTLGSMAAVLLLLIATSPFWTVLLLKRQASGIVNDSLRDLSASSLATVNISDGFLEMAVVLSTNDPAVVNEKLAQIARITAETDALLQDYSSTIDNPIDRQNFDRLVKLRFDFRETRRQTIELMNQGKQAEAVRLYNDAGLVRFYAYKDAIGTMVKYNVAEARERGTQILRLCNVLLVLQGVLLVFFSIYAFFVPLLTLFERIAIGGDKAKDI